MEEIYGNIVYIQDGYDFNMYVLHQKTKEFDYQLVISKTNDYHIGCETCDDVPSEPKKQVMINCDNLFYQGFLSFLENDIQIIIQDDLGYSRFRKQVTITRTQDGIELLFEYQERQCLNEFGIHILNVQYDGRSLIDQQGKDTKEKLYNLFNTLFDTFNEYESAYDGPILKMSKK